MHVETHVFLRIVSSETRLPERKAYHKKETRSRGSCSGIFGRVFFCVVRIVLKEGRR
jgi:hypothetical protein